MTLRVLLLLGAARLAAADDAVILQPVNASRTDLPERLLIFMPGGKVPVEYYKQTAQAIQAAATGLRLTVVVPSVFQNLCIIECSTSSLCAPLKNVVDKAVAKSGFKGSNSKEDTFIAGHSLGATCADNFVRAYSYNYAGLLEFGGYVDKTGDGSVANYSIPLMHLAGELDGGGARPGKLALYYKQFKDYAAQHGEEKALTMKPVNTLMGVDHSNFCPGFFVTATKDLCSEVTEAVALQAIGESAAAFLHLNSPTTSVLKTAAMATMKEMLSVSQKLYEPYLQAFEIENNGSWCAMAQHAIGGLSAADDAKLQVQVDRRGIDTFEHGHTNYTQVAGGGLNIWIISASEASTGFGPADIHGAAKSIDCKMIGADRLAEQLKVTAQQNKTCGEINKFAVEKALELIPAKSKERYLAQSRRVCYAEDTSVFFNIGPLFVKKSITLDEKDTCLEVASVGLVSAISSHIFPGNHYCKLLSPAMAMEWMMTDGVKPFPYDLDAKKCGMWPKERQSPMIVV
jgi:hypothetical protein